MRNALVLVFDRLASSYVGAYGNGWIGTRAWDRLAARALLLETTVADSDDLDLIYRAYWCGRHAVCGPEGTAAAPPPSALATRAVPTLHTQLITDEPLVADHVAGQDFGRRFILPAPAETEPAGTWEDTHLARLMATALDALEQAEPPFLLWVHAQAMHGPWDAPYELRARYADEEDPPPPRFVHPPVERLAPGHDPDLLLGFQQAYAGQVAVLDVCLRILLDALWSGPHRDSTLILATSPRGYPLGEHEVVGPRRCGLYSELVHVPCLVHWPDGAGCGVRAHELVQPPDLYGTLASWLDLGAGAHPAWGRDLRELALHAYPSGRWDCAVARSGSQLLLRVPYWAACQTAGQVAELYVKPDDRWEANNVAGRLPRVASEVPGMLAQFIQAAQAADWQQLAALPTVLAESSG